jgi:D-lactate dehydrogenase
MHIVFDRTEESEQALYAAALTDHQLTFLDAPLTDDLSKLPTDTEVLSVFVSSRVTVETMAVLPQLRHITTRSMGFDHIDLNAAKARNISVSRVATYGVRTVAEFTFALILDLSRKVHAAYDRLREEGTTDVAAFEGFDVAGKQIGIIGTGNIGKNVGRIARGFDMKVVLYDVYPNEEFAKEIGAPYVSLEELVATSDISSIHVPYMPETHHLINPALLAHFKKGSYFINTARGGLVDTKALVQALQSGHLAGAGLDVVEGERALFDELSLLTDEHHDINEFQELVASHQLLRMPNVILTPHIAFNTKEAKQDIAEITIKNIKGFVDGAPVNTI